MRRARAERVVTYMLPSEKKDLERAARAADTSVSEYVRRIVVEQARAALELKPARGN